MTAVVLALGSNQGDSDAIIRAAVVDLGNVDGIRDVRCSRLVRSIALTPAGPDAEAPPFTNAVVLAETSLEAEDLLATVLEIEARHGRVRHDRWGPRTLDIDIVTLEGVTRADAHLTLPHPEACRRDFVLQPWLELDPAAELPGYGSVKSILAGMESTPSFGSPLAETEVLR